MRKVVYILLTIGAIASLVLGGCAKLAPAPKAPPIHLKLIHPWATPKYPEAAMTWGWIEEVNTRSKGELVIEFIGGPEVIPAFDQAEATRSGMVDIHFGTHAFYLATVPEADVSKLWDVTGPELRKMGVYDLLNKIHQEKLNVYLLGLQSTPMSFQFYSNVLVKSPKEIKGLKIRVSPYYVDFVKALGAVATVITPVEVYTALERGTVDGMCWPTLGMMEGGFWQQIKYIIGPTFYRFTGMSLVNLDKWNKIPKHLQGIMTEAYIEKVEKPSEAYYQKLNVEERRQLLDKGLKEIQFSPEDAKWYVDLAYKSAWDALLARSPTYGPQLMEMIRKK